MLDNREKTPKSQKAPMDLSDKEIRTNLIRAQIEFLFSDAYLASEKFLLARMAEDTTGQGWVNISSIANMLKVKQLTTDLAEITDALSKSNFLEIDSSRTKIRRPNFKPPAMPKKKDLRRTVFVYGLTKDVQRDRLIKLLESYGNICRVVYDHEDEGPNREIGGIIMRRKFKVRQLDGSSPVDASPLLGGMTRQIHGLKTAFVVYESQGQATKCVKARSRQSADGIRTMHKYDYNKAVKKASAAKQKDMTPVFSPGFPSSLPPPASPLLLSSPARSFTYTTCNGTPSPTGAIDIKRARLMNMHLTPASAPPIILLKTPSSPARRSPMAAYVLPSAQRSPKSPPPGFGGVPSFASVTRSKPHMVPHVSPPPTHRPGHHLDRPPNRPPGLNPHSPVFQPNMNPASKLSRDAQTFVPRAQAQRPLSSSPPQAHSAMGNDVRSHPHPPVYPNFGPNHGPNPRLSPNQKPQHPATKPMIIPGRGAARGRYGPTPARPTPSPQDRRMNQNRMSPGYNNGHNNGNNANSPNSFGSHGSVDSFSRGSPRLEYKGQDFTPLAQRQRQGSGGPPPRAMHSPPQRNSPGNYRRSPLLAPHGAPTPAVPRNFDHSPNHTHLRHSPNHTHMASHRSRGSPLIGAARFARDGGRGGGRGGNAPDSGDRFGQRPRNNRWQREEHSPKRSPQKAPQASNAAPAKAKENDPPEDPRFKKSSATGQRPRFLLRKRDSPKLRPNHSIRMAKGPDGTNGFRWGRNPNTKTPQLNPEAPRFSPSLIPKIANPPPMAESIEGRRNSQGTRGSPQICNTQDRTSMAGSPPQHVTLLQLAQKRSQGQD